MRVRTTWDQPQIKAAAMNRQADPYTMNQDHPNPPTSKYESGNPSTWAEDPHPSKGTWEAEYANGQVKRDEIGMPEMRNDTFNHAEKTAAEKALLNRKAALAEKTARLLLAGKKVASEAAIEEQAWSLMQMPAADLMATYTRLADDQQEQEQQEKQAQEQQGQQEQKQAQQQEQGQEQKQACGPAPVAAPVAAAPATIPVADVEKLVQAAVKRAMDEQQALAQQQMQQAQQTQAQQQGQLAPMAQQQMDPLAQQQVQQPVAEDQLLDDMLAEQALPSIDSEMGIELEPAPMDVNELGLAPEDDVLMSLFSNQETQDAEQAKQAQEQGQEQQKQAGKTASRTMGTRPAAGVAKVGGGVNHGTRTAAADDTNRLSSLWQSAPDVREVFGTR